MNLKAVNLFRQRCLAERRSAFIDDSDPRVMGMWTTASTAALPLGPTAQLDRIEAALGWRAESKPMANKPKRSVAMGNRIVMLTGKLATIVFGLEGFPRR